MAGKKDWFLYSTDLSTSGTPIQYGLLADLSNTRLANPTGSILQPLLSHTPLPRSIKARHIIVESSVTRTRKTVYILNLTDFSNPAITANGVTFSYPSVGDEEPTGTEIYTVVGRYPEKISRSVTIVKHTIVNSETDPTATG